MCNNVILMWNNINSDINIINDIIMVMIIY